MKQKFCLALNAQELRIMIESLNKLRNKLIADGKYTDAIDEVLHKIIEVKQKKFKVMSAEQTAFFLHKTTSEKRRAKAFGAFAGSVTKRT